MKVLILAVGVLALDGLVRCKGAWSAMLVSRLGQVDGWLDLSSAIGPRDLSFSFADLGKRVVSEYLEGTGKRLVGGQRERLSRGA